MLVQLYQQRRDNITGGSGFYMGPKDSGKTNALRNEIEHVLNNTEEIAFVISRDGKFDDLAKKYDGLVIDVAKESLNPLIILDADKLNAEDLSFLSSIKYGLVKLMIESRIPRLTTLQKYVIDQVMSKFCRECCDPDWSQFVLAFNKMIESYKEKKIEERVEKIKASLNEVAADLNLTKVQTDSILLKETFLEELQAVTDAVTELSGIAAGSKQTPIGDHRLVIYDFKNVEGDDIDKYRLLAIEDVWTRLNGINPIKRARLCIDDSDIIFKLYDKYMSMLYKVASAHGLVISSVIQDTEAFLNKKLVFRNIASYFELFSHSPQVVEMLKPIFSLSKEEADWISDAPKGQMLAISGNNRFLVKPTK